MPIGHLVTLPSGRRVRVMCAADSKRRWSPVEVSPGYWHLCREHSRHGQAGMSHYFSEKKPLQLDEGDAKALAKMLNAAGGS